MGDPVVVGNPGEYEEMVAANPEFVEAMPSIERALAEAFAPGEPIKDTVPFMLVRQAVQDFFELYLLAANGYGLGALRTLRSLYERVVTAHWLSDHPEERQQFLDWSDVQQGKTASAMLEGFRDSIPAEQLPFYEQLIATGREVRDQERFQVTDCKKCGSVRPGHTWSLDLVAMAKKENLGNWLAPAYYETLIHTHATALSLSRLVDTSETGEVNFRPVHRAEARHALIWGHLVLLSGLDLIARSKGPGATRSALDEAMEVQRRAGGENISGELE